MKTEGSGEVNRQANVDINGSVQSPAQLIRVAAEHYRLGRVDLAESVYRNAINLYPRLASAHMRLALILKETGRFDEAAQYFQRVLTIKPDSVMAHYHLAHLKNHASTRAEIEAMQLLYNSAHLEVGQRVYLAFGLGTALDKNGEYEEAFGYFQAGHQLEKRSSSFDLSKWESFFKSLKEIFSEEYMMKKHALGPVDDTPIFIFGMPRSGTTLAEQILSSHHDVCAAGELSGVVDIVKRSIQITKKPFLEGWGELSRKEIYDFGTYYLGMLGEHSDGSGHVTDTTPMNLIYVGLISTILPNARLVHCHRDPMDTCLSIFQQPLSKSHNFGNDLEDLGGFYRLYENLMDHWHGVLPGKMHDLCYEKLVADFEREVRDLLDYCDLKFDSSCLRFYDTERSVRTPSACQVRQPIYSNSVGRWRRYESKLASLRDILL